MNWTLVILLWVLFTAAGFIHNQGAAMLVLSGFFGATDGIQKTIEANPSNPHPTVRLPKSDE